MRAKYNDSRTVNDVTRIVEDYLYAYLITGLAIGTFAGACVVAWVRR
jgi:hypothetical protein